MVAQSEKSPVEYHAGDVINANLILKPGHEPFALVSAQLSLATPAATWDPNRPMNFSLSGIPTTPIRLGPTGELLTVSGTVPHQIRGGTYRVTSYVFVIEDGPSKTQQVTDWSNGFVLTVADDPPLPHDDPVAIKIELLPETPLGVTAGSRVRDTETKQAGVVRRIGPDGMALVEIDGVGVSINVHVQELEFIG